MAAGLFTNALSLLFNNLAAKLVHLQSYLLLLSFFFTITFIIIIIIIIIYLFINFLFFLFFPIFLFLIDTLGPIRLNNFGDNHLSL